MYVYVRMCACMYMCVCLAAATALVSPDERDLTLKQEGSVFATKRSIVITSSEHTVRCSAVQSNAVQSKA
jgi:hypothetical protein